jgi:hypothetical protein
MKLRVLQEIECHKDYAGSYSHSENMDSFNTLEEITLALNAEKPNFPAIIQSFEFDPELFLALSSEQVQLLYKQLAAEEKHKGKGLVNVLINLCRDDYNQVAKEKLGGKSFNKPISLQTAHE